MAFNQQEQSIIKYGLDNGKSKEDVTKAITNFRLGITPEKPPMYKIDAEDSAPDGTKIIERRADGLYSSSKPISPSQPGLGERVGTDIQTAGKNINDAITGQGKYQGQSDVQRGFQATSEAFKAPVKVGYEALPEVARKGLDFAGEKINQGFNALTDKISNTKLFKEIGDLEAQGYSSPELKKLREVLGTTSAAGDISGNILVMDAIAKAPNQVIQGVKNIVNKPSKPPTSIDIGGKTITHADIQKPATQKFINSLSEVEQEATSKFDNLNTLYKQLENSKIKTGTYDPDLLEIYNQELKAQTNLSFNNQIETPSRGSAIGGLSKNIVKDVMPTADRYINTEVVKALDLTAGDVKNINLSTGNEVGRWIADNNLIGANKEVTLKNIDNFYETNYKSVRAEINKVEATYNPVEIPRYTEALKAIKQKITGTPGLQEVNYEVDNLLKKPSPSLADVQRVKELMDQHFSLYKMTGDVGEGVTKQGLANMRQDIKSWIENEVKDRTGVDISKLNNNVSTARSISDAIETRSTRGLTRATISGGDVLTFLTGTGFASPVGGAIALIVKKIYQSPSFKLKFTKWLDGISDASKAKVLEDLKSGVVPKDLQSFLDKNQNKNKA